MTAVFRRSLVFCFSIFLFLCATGQSAYGQVVLDGSVGPRGPLAGPEYAIPADLGNMVGTSRESVNKQMRAWEDEGLIGMAQGYITLLQPDKLKTLLH